MATAKGGYHTSDGTRVPSVTTILGRFKEAGGLIHWAWELGKEGKDYRQVRDEAALSGTIAHEAVEAWIKKQSYEIADERAQKSFEAFKEWADQTQLQVIETELGLVSEKHRFGGTLDAMLVRGKLSCGDWKTSNAVHPEYLCQIAAYGILWEENFPEKPILGGYHLMRFDKTYGDFSHRWWSELETAKKAFLLMRDLYDCDKELKARAK